MRNFLKSLSLKGRVAVCTGMVALTSGTSAFAQADMGQQILNQTATSMAGLVSGIVRVLQIGLGIGALITLVLAVFNIMKGEREAAQKMGWWVVGLALGFALLTVVSNAIIK